jgi:hypothetical protein
MRKAKPSVLVELTGPIAEVFLAKFQHLEEQNEKLIKSVEQNKNLMDKMMEEIKNLRNNPKISFTRKETANMLNMSVRTLDKCRDQNLIKYCKRDGKVWFTMKQMDDFNNGCEV